MKLYKVSFLILFLLASATSVSASDLRYKIFRDDRSSEITPDLMPTRPVIMSRWASMAPQIDGVFSPGEWMDAQILIETPIHTLVYFMNDYHFLYMCVDAADELPEGGDYTKEADDHCSVKFHDPQDGVGLGVTWFAGVDGAGSVDGLEAAVGFGTSPNSDRPHRIYELKIPFVMDELSWGYPDESVDFASPPTETDSLPYDWNGGDPRINLWPPGIQISNYETWGIIRFAHQAVGGEIMEIEGQTPMTQGIIAGFALMVVGVAMASRKRPKFSQ
jgi:hypothetical protein